MMEGPGGQRVHEIGEYEQRQVLACALQASVTLQCSVARPRRQQALLAGVFLPAQQVRTQQQPRSCACAVQAATEHVFAWGGRRGHAPHAARDAAARRSVEPLSRGVCTNFGPPTPEGLHTP